MPLVVTLLADLRQDSRRLVAFIFAVSGAALLGLFFVRGFWPVVVLLCLHSLAYVALTPLQDGLNFAVQQQRAASGQSIIPFHQIRVWGTFGFIVPSFLLFGFLANGAPLSAILLSAASFCALGLLNSFRLPDTREKGGIADGLPRTQLPVMAAARVLRRPPVLVFCLSIMLAHLASATYYAFYPLYLTEVVGIKQQWVGPIFNLGAIFEIAYMLGFGWLMARLKLKKFMSVGIFCLALRFALLAFYPSLAMAIGTQVLHGMMVVTLQVAPALYMNRQADDEYRTSMQGLLTVLTGASRVTGSVLAGRIAQESLRQAFGWAAALSLVATVFFVLVFHEDAEPES